MKPRTQRSSLAQRQLATRLRAARERAGLTQEDAAELLGIHSVTLSRIENAHTVVKSGQVIEMARLYGLDDKETDDLVALARGSKDPGWADGYRDVIPSTVSLLVDLEAAATGILDYAPELMPGLLQTPAYAEHLISLGAFPADTRRDLLAFRLERQQRVFAREKRPILRFVLHEAVLRTCVKSAQVMTEQLAHLTRLSRQRGIEIRVWTYEAGLHQWMSGAFTVLQSASEMYPHVVYTENQLEGRYLDIPDQVEKYARLFGEIRRKAIPMKEFQP